MIKKHSNQIILWLLIFVYLAYFSIFTVLRFQHLYAEYFDLGIMHQTVFNTFEAIKTFDFSRFLELTDPHGGFGQINRLAIHSDILLAFLAPFYFVHAGPETLLVLQTIVLAIGAWVVFKITREVLNNDFLGLIFGFAYLMYSPMQWANVFEFHAVTFATTFTLLMFYFFLKKRLWLSILFLVLALLTKEEIGLTLGMFGVYLGLRSLHGHTVGPKLYPFAITILSWAWSILSVFIIIPYFNRGQHFAAGYYTDAMHHAGHYIFRLDTLTYFIYLLGPLAFLSLLAPEFLIIVAPELAINLFSSDLQLRSLMFHYSSVIQPWVFIAAIYGTKKVLGEDAAPGRSLYPAFIIVALTLFFSFYASPLPYSQEKKVDPLIYNRDNETQIVKKWAQKLASDSIKVSATDQIAPYFTGRRYFYIFSANYVHADYVIVSTANIQFTYRNAVTIPAYKQLQNDPNFKKVDSQNGYEVYMRINR